MCASVSTFPWQTVNPKDFIYIESHDDLTMQDVRILTKLYKPIIGSAAYSFYQSLYAELDFKASNKLTSVSKLLTKMGIGVSDFYHARIRLEGMGLLENYHSQKNDNEYIYVLRQPLSAKEFLGDSLLRSLLMEQIGEKLFEEEVTDLIVPVQPKEMYEDLTRSFTEVYHFDLGNSNLADSSKWDNLKPQKGNKLIETIENIDSFDYQFFKQGLNKHFVRQDSLTDEIKELIYTYHIIYGIDELTMQSIILESADVESGKIVKNKLTHTVQQLYLNKQKKKSTATQITLENAKPAEVDTDTTRSALSKKGFTSSEISIIEHARIATPAHYLQSIKDQQNGFVTSNETWVLKELVEQSPLSKEVINILIHYILVIQKSVILEKNYATKIANDWAQSDIKTAEDAVIKLRNIFNESKNKTVSSQQSNRKKQYRSNYRRKPKVETLPAWAKDNAKPVEKENLPANQEEDDLKIRLEKIRRQRQLKEDS